MRPAPYYTPDELEALYGLDVKTKQEAYRTYNFYEAMTLYEAGLADRAVGRAVGISGGRFSQIRNDCGLPPNYGDGYWHWNTVFIRAQRLYSGGYSFKFIARVLSGKEYGVKCYLLGIKAHEEWRLRYKRIMHWVHPPVYRFYWKMMPIGGEA